ncbi:hypothetical protein BDR07DRAFT_1488081 [Suillus spraguei]|nr:hypothetical protein BDR07DRAFT_1488081 [Suillus spraguei]
MELPVPLQVRPLGAAAFCVTCAEGIFVLRTYALWGHKKSILALMLSTILCLAILNVIMTMKISRRLKLQLSDMGGGCYSLSYDKMAAYPWILLVAFETEIIVLTMIRVYWAYRKRGCLLLDILLQHNIFYFVTGLSKYYLYGCQNGINLSILALSVVNILAIEYFLFSYSNMFATFQIIMHTIVVTRMHLQFCTTKVRDLSTQSRTAHSQLTHELTQVELQTCSHSDA